MKVYEGGKLVRDKVPEIIEQNGDVAVYSVTKDIIKRLKDKLVEEATEASKAKTPEKLLEELSDVVEVLAALARKAGFNMQQLQEQTLKKVYEKGSFDQGYVLYKVTENEQT